MKLASVAVVALLLSAQAQAGPPRPYVADGSCPFECCMYDWWTAREPLTVYARERDTTEIVLTIAAGEGFRARTGNVHVLEPGIVVARHAFEVPLGKQQAQIAAGDTLWTLDYVGEGQWISWHRGRTLPIWEDIWCCPQLQGRSADDPYARLVREAVSEWWVEIRDGKGRRGWLRMPKNRLPVDGADKCA